jgi:hypothetical protein
MSSSNNNPEFQLANLFDVKGKVALVTGGGSGIGLMATQALAVNGAKVYIVGRTEEKLETVAETYGKDIAGEIIPITADVSKKEEIKDLVREISSREKCLCILINNAGIALNSQQTEAKTAEEMSKNLFDDEKETFDDHSLPPAPPESHGAPVWLLWYSDQHHLHFRDRQDQPAPFCLQCQQGSCHSFDPYAG